MTTNSAASVYELLANIFAKEPRKELLRQFQSEENKNVFRSCGINPLSDIEHLSIDKQEELLAVEYASLFLAPKRPIPLCESLQLGEGRLWGRSAVEVNRLYKKFGFELDDDFKETPDHLSAELAFLAKLSELELEYENKGMPEAKKGVLEVKKYFLDNHLLKWFAHFKAMVEEYSGFAYYREMTRFLGVVLNDEEKHLVGG